MAFSSIYFLFIFLPIAIIGRLILKPIKSIKAENIFLLILSIFFYAWCGIEYLIIICALALVNYGFGVAVLKSGNRKYRLIGIIGLDVIVLLVCKYFNFFIDNIEYVITGLIGHDYIISAPLIPLPLGVSFIVFQMISFEADNYSGKIQKRGIIEFFLYIFLFPQVIMGPIVRYSDIECAMYQRNSKFAEDVEGIRRFIMGLAKKVLIADQLSKISATMFEASVTGLPTEYAWIGIVCYAFVIYYDFSGYSDMAIGLCQYFGFHIRENFDYPYISCSIQEFWRRWHISLSSWFRDYVYIPLGGNRKGIWRTYRNLGIVFLLTGIWHGANWTFMIWGIWHGFFMLIERMGLGKILNKIPKVFGHVYCLSIVLVGWVFFNANDLASALIYLKCLFGITKSEMSLSVLQLFDNRIYVIILFAFVFSMPIVRLVDQRIDSQKSICIKDLGCIVLLVLSVATILSTGFNPSIYTKF